MRALLLCLLSCTLGCGPLPCDQDGDGFCAPRDCDDNDASVHPDTEDVCDGVDTNCNGRLADIEVDEDGDGVPACMECDDGDARVFPAADEVCDGVDNDCDGVVLPEELEDGDGDGTPVCLDCDDADPTRFLGAEEVCDGLDTNCDGLYFWDEAAGNGELTDEDGDAVPPCLGDCDDGEINVFAGNYEFLTDGLDNDCDGQADNKPLLSPELNLEPKLELLLAQECARHGREVATVHFEDGAPGEPVRGTAYPGFSIWGGQDGGEDFVYSDASPGGDEDSAQYAQVPVPVDGVSLRWDTPQTLVLWSIDAVDPNLGDAYAADIFWDGVNLGGIASIWGTADPDFEWTFRGLWSFQNVAFEEVVIRSPSAGGDRFAFDRVMFCE